ncbi:pol polyprotein [Daphnia sinensis]|uniref:Pol polyprotein n=1 Tax=Daphnia sinensis TaxID=1820382 RepID=A0AAD5PSN2_9CRUS|nr:pol polyprotein [Daphnia sinensis]
MSLHTNHKTTSSYHPQANGAVERMNHTLAAMLSMYVSTDQRDWDETLQYVCFAYNTARQESTGYSPFFLLYGREPKLPIDLELGADADPLLTEDGATLDYADRLLVELSTAREIEKIRMEEVKNKQKERHDSHHRDLSFQAGDLVLVYKPFRKVGKSEKLLHRCLPGAADNGTHSVSFSNLPDFLAVAADLETFLELSKDDVRECSKIGRPLCKFHTGISKRNGRKSCAIAVFMNDIPRIKTQCRKKFAD